MLLKLLDDVETRCAVEAERAFARALGGSCHSPVAALATVSHMEIHLRAEILSEDGKDRVRDQRALRAARLRGRRQARPRHAGARAGIDPPAVQERMRQLVVLRPEPGAGATVAAAKSAGLEAVAMPLFEIGRSRGTRPTRAGSTAC